MPGQDIPLFAEQVFLYDGDPNANGIVAYDAQYYRDYYDDVEFVEPSRLIDSLVNDLETDHLDILRETDNARFVIPDYQRYYSWEENQHQEFWEEVLQIIHLQPMGFELPPENYFGTIYVGQLDARGTFEVIDGQQRLTTLTILLYRVQQHLVALHDSVDGDLADLAGHVVEDWLGELLFRTEGPRDVPFVEPNEHDQQFFEILFEEDEAEKLEAILELDTYDGRRSNAVIRREVVEEYGISDTTIEAYEIDQDTLDDDYVYFAESHRLLIEAAKFYDGKIEELLYRLHSRNRCTSRPCSC